LIVISGNGDWLATTGQMRNVVPEVRKERRIVLLGSIEEISGDDHAVDAPHNLSQLSIKECLILSGVGCAEMEVAQVEEQGERT